MGISLAVGIRNRIDFEELSIFDKQLNRVLGLLRKPERISQHVLRPAPSVNRQKFHAGSNPGGVGWRSRNTILQLAIFLDEKAKRIGCVEVLTKFFIGMNKQIGMLVVNQAPSTVVDSSEGC